MEVTALCFTLWMNVLLLLVSHLHLSYSQKAGVGFPQVDPNRQQHFEYDSIVVSCEGLNGLTGWRVMKKIKKGVTICASSWETSIGPCEIKTAYPELDSGEYWCVMGAKRSNTVNITVTAGPVILESPALPVMKGDNVTLSCRKKETSFNLPAGFYKDGFFLGGSSTGNLTMQTVSTSNEGLYRCNISGSGESAQSWLKVTAGPVILESPALPVMEGDDVTLSCRKKETSSNLTADFYKDGFFLQSSSTGNLTIYNVSRSDEGLYRCSISGSGESAESWLKVTADEESQPSSHHPPQVYLPLGISVSVLLASLLLLVGLLRCRKHPTTTSGAPASRYPFECSSSPQTEACAAEPLQATYAVVTYVKKEKVSAGACAADPLQTTATYAVVANTRREKGY